MFGELNEVPKPEHKRRTPKKAQRGEFSTKMRFAIGERDDWSCVRCRGLANHIHHVIFRSQGGDNSKRNGVSICIKCHSWAHAGDEGRRWFEQWVDLNLDEDGNLKLPFTDIG